MQTQISLVVTTYQRPNHLRRTLEGLRLQRGATFEVIVADDGSGPETAAAVLEFAQTVPFRVVHVWQENQGFRAARIRNLGAKAARGERILFLDGDCPIPPKYLCIKGF